MSKVVNKAARQGDVMIIAQGIIPRLDVADKTLTPSQAEQGRQVVAHGEATGHHHSFPWQRGVVLFRDESNAPQMLETDAPVALSHQEHSAITFAPGKYTVLRQRTYHSGLSRRVVD